MRSIGNNMKTYPLMSAQVFRRAALAQVIFLFLTWLLTNACFGDPQINPVGWRDNFQSYTNLTPLIGGTQGWYASSADCIVQEGVGITNSQAAMLPIDVTLSNRFDNTYTRIVSMEMYVRPQLYDGTNYPDILGTNYPGISANVAAQFFINSNGYFVISNGTNWNEATKMVNGELATPVTNTCFSRVQVNLRYKNHTWNLKAWTTNTPGILLANTRYVNFTSNLNTFGGFDIYNGNSTSYVDDVSVITGRQSVINGVPFDTIQSINGAYPALINGVSE